jgi:CRISPR/Cas system-associated protein Csm6
MRTGCSGTSERSKHTKPLYPSDTVNDRLSCAIVRKALGRAMRDRLGAVLQDHGHLEA